MIDRISIIEVMLRFAELLSERSTCQRLKVGAVVTDARCLQVLGVGYNGNARGLPNACDDPTMPGTCGCIHAELNALLKSPGTVPDKNLFTTNAPCVMCAKAAVNAGIRRVFYRRAYRRIEGLAVLRDAGLTVTRLDGRNEPPHAGWPSVFDVSQEGVASPVDGE